MGHFKNACPKLLGGSDQAGSSRQPQQYQRPPQQQQHQQQSQPPPQPQQQPPPQYLAPLQSLPPPRSQQQYQQQYQYYQQQVPYYQPQYTQPPQGAPGSHPSTRGGHQQQQGRVYGMDAEQPVDRSVIRGTVLIFGSVARTLIDTGASYSFISSTLARTMSLRYVTLRTPLTVTTPVQGNIVLDRDCRDCLRVMAGFEHTYDFI